MSSVDEHEFNDDLLLDERDRQLAAKRYPSIFHVLDHPELRRLFVTYDVLANRAKRSGRRLGILAVTLVLAALLFASMEHLLPHGSNAAVLTSRLEEWPTIVAALSGALGTVGVLIGSVGLLFAKRKRHWLLRRLMTERLRQFHFQEFVYWLPQISASLANDRARSEYVRQRKLRFDASIGVLRGKLEAELTKMTDEANEPDEGMIETKAPWDSPVEEVELAPLFAAYREFRILHQLDYANYRLGDDHRIFSSAPRRQATILSMLGLILIVFLVLLHIAVIAIVLMAPAEWASAQSILATAALWIALNALALRAIEAGLQPEREIERYQQYRSAVRAILRRFDEAPTQNGKLRVMQEMEQAAFDELRNFLITTQRSRFVM